MDTVPSLSNPYFSYPGSPFRGYHNLKLYNTELLRLSKYIDDFITNPIKECLFHLCIGAAFEEIAEAEDYANIYTKYSQWRQLFPDHVEKFAIEQNGPVRICIISPNTTFELDNFKDPLFIKYTNSTFNWERTSDLTYISKSFDIIVNIFCTMMPHNDQKRNNNIMSYIKKNKIYEMINWVLTLEQTEQDIQFINIFYNKLKILFDIINQYNGIITCFSFAVFNEATDYYRYNEYEMFSEIKELFGYEYNNRLLCRWIFEFEHQIMKVYNNKTFNKIVYVNIIEYLGKNRTQEYISFGNYNDKNIIAIKSIRIT
ncbi:hypothetical protein QKU48_gp0159 [Fadolivirus algeromassiliense]|jgi:hypothetical protein|uniref:Uncharacterized protein n=1 Tax=Fadolivirus FV1/VV64 TaxID=3070911 RepID=A0A7D3V8J6_9VIRU|nr:hypothetical protein QKU48_gp0159 [Fadolivirus algeromassiliense]QKF93617.1 hypothetical protein Fadolivirus_1_159 [Fadolivirus FV1/VV64]